MEVVKKEFYNEEPSKYEAYLKIVTGEFFGLELYAIARSKIVTVDRTISIGSDVSKVKFELGNEIDIVLETLSGPVRIEDAIRLGLDVDELKKFITIEMNKTYKKEIPDHVGNISYFHKMQMIDILKTGSRLERSTDGVLHVCCPFIHNIVNSVPGFECVAGTEFYQEASGDKDYGITKKELFDCVDALLVLGFREIELEFDGV